MRDFFKLELCALGHIRLGRTTLGSGVNGTTGEREEMV